MFIVLISVLDIFSLTRVGKLFVVFASVGAYAEKQRPAEMLFIIRVIPNFTYLFIYTMVQLMALSSFSSHSSLVQLNPGCAMTDFIILRFSLLSIRDR